MIRKKQKKSLVYLFMFLIVAVVVYNMSFANEIKVYMSDNNEEAGESEYAVDLYVDTGDIKVGGFQLKLSYPECLEMKEVIDGDVGQTDMNKYAKKITGQKGENSEGKSGKVKLCTVVFKVIERSSDNKYNVKIDYTDKYSKVVGVDGKRIDVDDGTNNDGNEGNNGANNNGGDNNNGGTDNGNTNNGGTDNNDIANGGNSNNSKNVSEGNSGNTKENSKQGSNDDVSIVDNSGDYKDANKKNGKLPQAGSNSVILLVDIALIAITVAIGIKLFRTSKKNKDDK